jgi:hypothetical protein
VTIQATEVQQEQASSQESVRPIPRGVAREPGLLSMIVAVLVLLVAVSVVVWTSSSVPNGRSVVVTVRNP